MFLTFYFLICIELLIRLPFLLTMFLTFCFLIYIEPTYQMYETCCLVSDRLLSDKYKHPLTALIGNEGMF